MGLDAVLDDRMLLRPVAIDDYAEIRHLHAAAIRAATVGVLSELEVAAFVTLVHSADYPAILMKEDAFGAWLDGELVGTASWQTNAANGHTARIGSIFVRHPRFGIGRRLVAEVEKRAHQSGFDRLAAGVTANAVPFFERLGYTIASHGVKTYAAGCSLPVTFLRKELTGPRSGLH